MPIESKTGGAYIPPARLKQLQASITDKSSEAYQKLTWEALKKSINGLINKVNVANIKFIIPEIFSENLVRGQGVFVKSIMKAQQASQPFTPVFAAVVAIINTKFPMIGELLINRLLMQFRRAYKRSDKQACLSSTNFIAHLVNQRVANEIVALQILTLLLERPTDDSVEVAVGYMRQVGAFLLLESTRACNAVFERFRGILHEGKIDKRSQYMVEVLFQVRKENFKDHVSIPEGLDIVEEEDQITHMIGLTDDLDVQEGLNVFRFDQEFLSNEAKYEAMKREILGEESDDEEGSEEGSDDEDEEEIEEQRETQIRDATNTNLVNLRRAIYLCIMSSLNFEECAHKLLKLTIQPGQEIELANMVIECCSQETTYVNFYGLLGERFCQLSQEWASAFAQSFEETFQTVHRFESNRLRNIAKFFAHVLASDALTWEVFGLIRLTEQDTTSSSRIFCKILFQELSASMGLTKLNERLHDQTMVVTVETPSGLLTRNVFDGLFPKENLRDTRFAINYFTSIGLGGLTEEMREFLKTAAVESESSESDSSSGSDTSSESDSSESEDDRKPPRRRDSPQKVQRRESRSPVRSRRSSPSPARRRRDSRSPVKRARSPVARRRDSRSPPPRRRLDSRSPVKRAKLDSRSPPARRRRDSRSPPRRRRDSRSPPRRRRDSRSPPGRSSRSPKLSGTSSLTNGRLASRDISRSPPRRSPSPSQHRERKPYQRYERAAPAPVEDQSVAPVSGKVHPSRLNMIK